MNYKILFLFVSGMCYADKNQDIDPSFLVGNQEFSFNKVKEFFNHWDFFNLSDQIIHNLITNINTK